MLYLLYSVCVVPPLSMMTSSYDDSTSTLLTDNSISNQQCPNLNNAPFKRKTIVFRPGFGRLMAQLAPYFKTRPLAIGLT